MFGRIVAVIGVVGVLGILALIIIVSLSVAAVIDMASQREYMYHAKCYSNGTVIFDANVKKKADYFITQDDTVVYLPEKDCVLVRIK